jgi:hypothetical protein
MMTMQKNYSDTRFVKPIKELKLLSSYLSNVYTHTSAKAAIVIQNVINPIRALIATLDVTLTVFVALVVEFASAPMPHRQYKLF